MPYLWTIASVSQVTYWLCSAACIFRELGVPVHTDCTHLKATQDPAEACGAFPWRTVDCRLSFSAVRSQPGNEAAVEIEKHVKAEIKSAIHRSVVML